MTIGRSSKHCTISFPENAKGVSGLHCTLTCMNKTVMVTDENSTYGTWIQDTRLKPGKPTVMYPGQSLYIGSKNQKFSLKA